MDLLGYGAHLIVDGFGASAPLADEPWVIESAMGILPRLGIPDSQLNRVSYWFPEGVSVGLLLPNGHLTMHTYTQRQLVSVSIFNPHVMLSQGISDLLRERFNLGRAEGYLGSRTVTFPPDHHRAVKQLLGERRYTDVRLDDTLIDV